MEINSASNGNGLSNGKGHSYTNGLDNAAKLKLIDQVIISYNFYYSIMNFK